ncbi:tigger transposable element-derived protein 4-like [Uloborus diversus]|uniref:tigger transposable element-derived protein 4-like n=1 Tax=Uloborus diversus TaxID=327109 RepID=UPI002409C9D3|nr:tigger transposable element-derived protein 4-like [Uloborus diversus]
MSFKGDKCSGGKHSKDRITLLVGANMDGTEKLQLLMIGKSKNPRCFENVKTKPVMTRNIFEEWLLDLNRRYQRKNRKNILFIDNCQAHKSVPAMENVTVKFFLPNMTSVLQPMDQGVIKNLKHFYGSLVVQYLLTESSIKLPVTFLDASRMCMVFSESKNDSKLFDEENLTLPTAWTDSILFHDFVNVYENIDICGELSDTDIVSEVLNEQSKSTEDDEDIENDIE